jgi:hypothetical protein
MKSKKIKIPKEKPPSKEMLVRRLAVALTNHEYPVWDIIAQLTGRKIPETIPQKANFLKMIFVKSRSRSAAKGIARNLQNWAAQQIAQVTGLSCGKDEEIASREMGQTGPDVRMSRQARERFPFTIECKSGHSWSLPAAIKQAQANLYPDTHWMVVVDRPHIHQDKAIPQVVALDGELFFRIWKGFNGKIP